MAGQGHRPPTFGDPGREVPWQASGRDRRRRRGRRRTDDGKRPPHHYDRGRQQRGAAGAGSRTDVPGRLAVPAWPSPADAGRPGRLLIEQPADEGPASGAGPARRRRWLWVVFIVVVAAIAVASRVNLNYYAIQPGTAQSVQQFITVPADKSHPVTHPVLLTDVELGRVTALVVPLLQAPEQHHPRTAGGVTGGTPLAAGRPRRPRDVPGRGRRQDGSTAPPRVQGRRHPVGSGHLRHLPGHSGLPGAQRG